MKYIYMQMFMLGIRGWKLRPWLRRLLVGTNIHLAWLHGWYGFHIDCETGERRSKLSHPNG